MKKAAIYLRVSSTDQDYDRQQRDLKQLAKITGYEVVRVYEEKKSAVLRMDTREQLSEMRKLTKDEIERIFIWDVTRLSRRAIDFISLVNEFTDKGICLHFKDKNIVTLDEKGKQDMFTSIYLYILGLFAQMDAENLQAKMRSGREAALARGNSYTHSAPFGYILVDKHLVILEEEAQYVRKMYNTYKENNSIQYLMDLMNASKVPVKGQNKNILWARGTIYRILKNSVYYGKGKYTEVLRKDEKGKAIEKEVRYYDVPAIISKELYDQVQKNFEINKTYIDKSSKTESILRGLIKCGYCGRDYVFARNPRVMMYTDGDKRANINRKKGCNNGSMAVNFTDNLVWNAIKGIYEYETFKEKYAQEKEKNQIKLNENIGEVKELQNSLSELDRQTERVNNGFSRGLYSIDEALQQKDRIKKDGERISKIIDKFKAENSLLKDKIDLEFDYNNYFSKELSTAEKKRVCSELIEVIYTYSYGAYKRLLHIKLKLDISINLFFNCKSHKYCAVDDDVITFIDTHKVPEEISLIVKNKIKDKEFEVTNNNNALFGEEIFGSYSYDEVIDILERYKYLKIMD
jgi:DNA invertase Pin-like site-specific DNA recombinase